VSDVPRVSAREAHALLRAQGYAYLDVRSVPEFDAGHPEGAYNVPIAEPAPEGMRDNPRFLAEVEVLFAKSAPLVVGCASGVRSLRAAELLRAQGFTRVVEQRAGMEGVRDAFGRVKEKGHRAEGLPVATRAAPGRNHAEVRALLARAGDAHDSGSAH
jgi:rhodanese-related sulfurtransferase